MQLHMHFAYDKLFCDNYSADIMGIAALLGSVELPGLDITLFAESLSFAKQ